MPVTMVRLLLYPVPVRHGLLPGLRRRARLMHSKIECVAPPHPVLPRMSVKGMEVGQFSGETQLAMVLRTPPSNLLRCRAWTSWTFFRHSRSFTALGFQRTLMLPKHPGTGEMPVAINFS